MPVDKKIHLRLKLLDHLLRRSGGITYRMIQECYGNEGFKVSIRTIQKDIEILQADYQADLQVTRVGHQVRVRYKDTTKSVFSSTSTSSLIEDVKSRLEKEIFNAGLRTKIEKDDILLTPNLLQVCMMRLTRIVWVP